MKLERTHDMALVREIIRHPKIYGPASDDFSPPRETFEPEQGPWYILLKEEDKILGLWALCPHSQIVWEVHTCMLPTAWGTKARDAAQLLLSWVWENTTCVRLITQVPDSNPVALRFAENAGLVEYGRNPFAFQKHNRLYTVHELGITRPGTS